MSEVKQVKVKQIDLESSVNVRIKGVEANVEKVKSSIAKHGFWPEHPIVIRPHPNPGSGYQYEHVAGQCRFKACLSLGLDKIPAIVEDLDDDAAIQRSWGENEAQGELSLSDKAHWVTKIYKRHEGNGFTGDEAMKKAADFLNIEVQTARKYARILRLPAEVRKMVDERILPSGAADAIANSTFRLTRTDEEKDDMEKQMAERANWFLDVDRNQRTHALQALNGAKHNTSIEELTNDFTRRVGTASYRIEIPQERLARMEKWGEEHGITGNVAIINSMIRKAINE